MGISRRFIVPFAVLAIGLVASALVYLQLDAMQRAREHSRFASLSAGAVASIDGKLRTQLTVLRGLAGLFNASDTVTAEEFRNYVDRLRLRQNNPGVLGVGYSLAVNDEADHARALALGRAAHGPEFRIWPDVREARSAIIYLEPLNRRNREAIGFDMMSEATRRAAMSAAADVGQSRMSGSVELVQEIGVKKQPGFLIYTPVQDAESVAGLRGWVFSPLRAHDLFRSAVDMGKDAQLSVALYGGAPEPDNLLFRNTAPAERPSHTATHTLETAGRGLTIVLATTPAFAASQPMRVAPIAGLSGVLATLLLAAMAWQQSMATARVQRQVNERTAELQAANQSLLDEAEARAAAEEQVRHMYRIESLGKLTGGIAHDFNNMLAVVIGNLDLAVRRKGDADRVGRLIEQARLGAVRAAELTQRLLVFSRQQALASRVLDPNRLVSDMSELLARTLGETVVLRTRQAGDLWRVEADPTQLESAILNLAVNARDAMPDGGTLTIETTNVSSGGDGQDMVSIAVIDTGTGMSDEVRQRAFDPFFTTKEVGRGTGLGLSQVFGFARQSGGEVKIDSRLGEGTTVCILLPRSTSEASEVAADVPEGGDVPRGSAEELIVVVEDETQVRMVTVEVLRDLGYTVQHAADGDEALAVMEQSPGARLMFTDIVMPGMNGAALAEIVRQRWPDTKILFTTGYAPDELLEGRKLGQGVALLQKPFTPDQLAFRVREVLDR